MELFTLLIEHLDNITNGLVEVNVYFLLFLRYVSFHSLDSFIFFTYCLSYCSRKNQMLQILSELSWRNSALSKINILTHEELITSLSVSFIGIILSRIKLLLSLIISCVQELASRLQMAIEFATSTWCCWIEERIIYFSFRNVRNTAALATTDLLDSLLRSLNQSWICNDLRLVKSFV